MYAGSGSKEFNERVDGALRQIALDVRRQLGKNLIALILGGGYGRGEGGVLRSRGGEALYNDLDFFIVVKNKYAVSRGKLDAIGRACQKNLSVHADFGRPLTPGDIRSWPHTLMWKELLEGHRVLFGPEDLLRRTAPAHLSGPLPPIEATRLLLNRGAGLLWALRVVRGHEAAPDPDFVKRNYFKCALALGDALLIVLGRYRTRQQERGPIFRELSLQKGIVRTMELEGIYEEALKFKVFPDLYAERPMDRESLDAMVRKWEAVFLCVERTRTGLSWDHLEAYVRWAGIRESGQNRPYLWPRNGIKNLRFGALSLRHPREHLYRTLPGLLRPAGLPDRVWDDRSSQFLRVWRQCN